MAVNDCGQQETNSLRRNTEEVFSAEKTWFHTLTAVDGRLTGNDGPGA
jgi:hypothetical protein